MSYNKREQFASIILKCDRFYVQRLVLDRQIKICHLYFKNILHFSNERSYCVLFVKIAFCEYNSCALHSSLKWQEVASWSTVNFIPQLVLCACWNCSILTLMNYTCNYFVMILFLILLVLMAAMLTLRTVNLNCNIFHVLCSLFLNCAIDYKHVQLTKTAECVNFFKIYRYFLINTALYLCSPS